MNVSPLVEYVTCHFFQNKGKTAREFMPSHGDFKGISVESPYSWNFYIDFFGISTTSYIQTSNFLLKKFTLYCFT